MEIIRTKEANHKYRKVFIDTKYRTNGTPSDFTVLLPEVLEMSHNMRFCVDDVALPRSWYNVGANNNNVYVAWVSNNVFTLWYIQLTPGDYDGISLATELQNKLNTPNIFSGSTFSVVFNRNTGRLQITNSSHQFWLPTDNQLVALGATTNYVRVIDGVFYTINLKRELLKSANYILGNLSEQTNNYNTLLVLDPINTNWLDTIYIHCYSIGSYNTINLRGEKSIIKEVKIMSAPFDYVFDNANNNFDWMDCSHAQWSTLSFSLRDKNGNLVDFNNRDLSFSLVLDDLTI